MRKNAMMQLSPKMRGMSPEVFRCETSTAAGYAQDWHVHDCYMLLLPRRGGLFVSTEESTQNEHVSNHRFSIMPPDYGHATTAAPGMEKHITLYVDPGYVDHWQKSGDGCDIVSALGKSKFWRSSSVLASILSLHDQLSVLQSQPMKGVQLQHVHHLLFQECMHIIVAGQHDDNHSVVNRNMALVTAMQTYIRENLQEKLDIDTLCRQFQLSRRHLTRLFREVAQESLVDFTNRTRVEKAARLIAGTHDSILDIGLSVGIESPSYLARLFKKYIGVLPSDCRQPH